MDDSYFSGRTLTVVHEAVEELGGHMIGAYVAYLMTEQRKETRALCLFTDTTTIMIFSVEERTSSNERSELPFCNSA